MIRSVLRWRTDASDQQMISSIPIWIAGLRALIGDIRMPGCRAGLHARLKEK